MGGKGRRHHPGRHFRDGDQLSDSAPRRPVGRGTIYVDYETGFEVTDAQYRRIENLADAAEMLFSVMHECEGTLPPGEHQDHIWSSRRMRRAAETIEVGMMLAKRAALEVP
jgi:hypothetical protein